MVRNESQLKKLALKRKKFKKVLDKPEIRWYNKDKKRERKEVKKMLVQVFDFEMEQAQYEEWVAELKAEWEAMDEEDREWYDDYEDFEYERMHAECYSED